MVRIALLGVIASSPRHSMITPNECRGKVDVSQPTVTCSAGA
jgi:hypothetical protein